MRKLEELSVKGGRARSAGSRWPGCCAATARFGKVILKRTVSVGERALSLGPNNADLLALAASTSVYMGAAERGPELADRALRLNPHHPHWWNTVLATAYFHGGEFAKAYPFARKVGLALPDVGRLSGHDRDRIRQGRGGRSGRRVVVRLDPQWRVEDAFGPAG